MKEITRLLLVMISAALFLNPTSGLFAESSKAPPSDLVSSKKQMLALKNQLQKMEVDLSAMRSEVTGLQDDLSAMRSEVTALHGSRNYGSWVLYGDTVTTVADRAPVVFAEAPGDINFSDGILTFPQKGIYLVTFGVTTKNASSTFEILLSGKTVPGGKLTTTFDGTLFYATGTVTVIIPIKSKESLQILNTSGFAAQLGTGEKKSTAASLSIVQIQ